MPFTVCTCNVLADAYVRPEHYPRVAPEHLDPAWRGPALVRYLAGQDADLFCLQEVEEPVFAALLAELGPRGFEGHLARKGNGRPDGCALFQRKDILLWRGVSRLEYTDGGGEGGDSGHVAQVALVEHEGRLLGVGNTHLRWDKSGTAVEEMLGLRQVRQLLKERTSLAPGATGWLIAGDFNVVPESEVVTELRTQGFEFAHHALPEAFTSNTGGRARVIDYLFHDRALEATPLLPAPLERRTPMPGPDFPSDHLALLARFAWADPHGGRL